VKHWLLIGLLAWLLSAQAAQELYPFSAQTQREQFTQLTQEVRCLVCQNQAIADSNAPFANDLRAELYTLIQQHKTTEEIKATLTQRYGAYVLFQPPVVKQTWLLWLAPLLMLLVGVGVLYQQLRKRR
jgi:cytochrome c-type biogenesis protein CcmH